MITILRQQIKYNGMKDQRDDVGSAKICGQLCESNTKVEMIRHTGLGVGAAATRRPLAAAYAAMVASENFMIKREYVWNRGCLEW